MTRLVLIIAALLALAFTPLSCQPERLRIGSKKFTESVILGELLTRLASDAGTAVVHYPELGGTRILFNALRAGDIDAYVEYTGTIEQELLAGQPVEDVSDLRSALAEMGITMGRPLGFNNTYALAMRRGIAAEKGITKISDLTRFPDLAFGFGNEFLDRGDGWPNLRKHYGLPQQDVRGLDHDLAYRMLDNGAISLMDAYTTDAKIEQYELALLEDDRNFFPRYDAVILYRAELSRTDPDVVDSLLRLEGQVQETDMQRLNACAELDKQPESRVAAAYLEEKFGITSDVAEKSAPQRIWQRTLEHLDLVRKSLVPAILLAIPLGIWAAKRRAAGQMIVASVGIIQTIPSFALLVMLIAPVSAVGLASVGLGTATAVTALFLYSLLPIVRNTHAGLHGIAPQYDESARALGLPPAARLRLVELPLASRTILAGIKTAAILNIGFATLGALVGAGGYGQTILTGIRLANTRLMLEGAVPAAAMALIVQGLFELAEIFLVPRGLRIQRQH